MHSARGIAPSAAPVAVFPDRLIELRGARLELRGTRLLDGVDATIRSGRRTVILGANGAGKSLLLRVMHGLVRPSGGEVLWHGRPLDKAARRAQAMVFQRPVMLRRSVLANLRFALAVRGIGRAERRERARAALADAGLEALADRPARVLSGGEQQRLAIARALAAEPEILFLDEPTASLDPAATDAVETLIAEANARGIAIVLVTHDRGQARRVGQDALFMHAGRVVEGGDVARLLETPRSAPARAWTEGRLHLDPGSAPTG